LNQREAFVIVDIESLLGPKMLFETNELNQVYHKIKRQYDENKKLIIAPCRCKLYVSRSSQVIDCEGKTSPNWFLFATGLTAVVYDSANSEMSLNLFDLSSARLTWMMRLTEDSHMYAPNSNFHVINTKSDCSEHVGLLYDDKDVAAMFSEKLSTLLAARVRKSDRHYEGEPGISKMAGSLPEKVINLSDTKTSDETRAVTPKKKQNKIIRSLSMYFKRSSKHSSKTDSESVVAEPSQTEKHTTRQKKLSKEERVSRELAEDSMKEISGSGRSRYREKRRMRHSNRSKTLGAESFINWAELKRTQSSEGYTRRNSVPDFIVDRVEDIFPSREQIPKAKDDFDRSKMQSGELGCEAKSTWKASWPKQHTSDSSNNNAKPKRKSSRGLHRSLSERRPNGGATAGPNCLKHDGVVRLREGARVEKPRATSDTLLLKGNTITCLVETGHMAKYQRERKQWMAILEKGNVQTTDLCVTEL